MRSTLSFVLLGTITMCGCASTLRVKRDPLPVTEAYKSSTDVSGIPFYIKVAKCKQETSWLQPFYTLTLKKTTSFKFVNEDAEKPKGVPAPKPPEPVVRTVTKVLSLSDFNSTDVRNFRVMLSKPGQVAKDQVKTIEDAWKKISDLQDYSPLGINEDTLVGSKDAMLMTNTSAPEAAVDYSRVYYYNASRPWIGTSQLDAKLASDGTLTEGSAQVDDQTVSTILSALPIGTLLTQAAGVPAPTTTAATTALLTQAPEKGRPVALEETIQYDLTITQDGYTHTHTHYVDFALPCPVAKNGVKTDFALTIKTVAQSLEKKDANTIKVSGSIVLPTAAGDKSSGSEKK